MDTDAVKKAAWRGALYNYGRVVVRIGLGLVTFRLLFQGLSPEEFGFWSLMWSVFGYGILLDFGFGYAAQRRVAQSLANRDWPALSHALSTIFFFYFGSAVVIALLGWALAEPMMHWFGVPDERHGVFKPVAVVFFAGMALGFPLGVFPEVLRGLQRSDTVNRISMGGLVANAIFVALALHFHWGLMSVFVIALACVLIPDLIAGYAAFKAMPEVRLRPSLFRMSDLLSTGKFSLFAWANMISNLLRNKMDQVIVGGLVGLPAVALYQSGGKAGEMFGVITRQIADALSPAAAFLHADARVSALREMLMKGLRLTVLVAAPFYVGGALYLDLMVRLLTGLKQPEMETLAVGQILLFWYFHLSITHLVFKNMFMMCGHERRLMWQSLGEASLNIVLSVGLTMWSKSIIGVAAGSVLPTVYFGWFVLWRWASVEAAVGKWELFRLTAMRPILACVPMAITGILFRSIFGPSFGHPEWVPSLIGMAITGVAGALGVWFIALNSSERAAIAKKLPARFRPAVPKG